MQILHIGIITAIFIKASGNLQSIDQVMKRTLDRYPSCKTWHQSEIYTNNKSQYPDRYPSKKEQRGSMLSLNMQVSDNENNYKQRLTICNIITSILPFNFSHRLSLIGSIAKLFTTTLKLRFFFYIIKQILPISLQVYCEASIHFIFATLVHSRFKKKKKCYNSNI